MTSYITEQQFLDYTRSKADPGNDQITAAIEAASRKIDAYAGRFFYSANTTMYVRSDWARSWGRGAWELDLCDIDIATSSGLALTTDSNGDGTYATSWTLNTDYILEPVNTTRSGISGHPYTFIRAVGSKTFPLSYRTTARPEVKLVGTFGWTAVPGPIAQATKILASMLYKLGEAPLGVAGWGAYGDIRIKDIPQVEALISHYRKGSGFGIA